MTQRKNKPKEKNLLLRVAMTKDKIKSIGIRNEVTDTFKAKEQKTISTSELTDEDIKKLPNKEFLKIIKNSN